MRIVDIRELTVPLKGNIANAVVNFSAHTVSLVAVVTDQVRDGLPVVGLGFNSIGRFAQSGILRERLIPRLLETPPEQLLDEVAEAFNPQAVVAAAMRNEKPGGHGDRASAVAALELAVWDANAKLREEPAWQNIRRAASLTAAVESEPALSGSDVEVYAAGGYYYPGDSLSRLRDELKAYQQLGYASFKIKIGGASLTEDMQRVAAAVDIAGAGHRVAVDANGRFDLATAMDYGRALQELNVRWYEEPGDPLDFELNRALIEVYQAPVATGENLFSCIDTLNLLRFGGMRPGIDVIQVDPGLSYGLVEYMRLLQQLESAGYSRAQCFPHGGHLINLHVVLGLGLAGCEAYPGVFQPFGGYSPQCRLADARIAASAAPGFGLVEKPELLPYIYAVAPELERNGARL